MIWRDKTLNHQIIALMHINSRQGSKPPPTPPSPKQQPHRRHQRRVQLRRVVLLLDFRWQSRFVECIGGCAIGWFLRSISSFNHMYYRISWSQHKPSYRDSCQLSSAHRSRCSLIQHLRQTLCTGSERKRDVLAYDLRSTYLCRSFFKVPSSSPSTRDTWTSRYNCTM